MSTTCESCGADEHELWAVHRRYVTVESWDTPGTDRMLDEIEHWCFACCTHYPHEPIETASDRDSSAEARQSGSSGSAQTDD